MISVRDLSPEQAKKIDLLLREGWSITHVYGDKVVNLTKTVNGEQVMIYISADATVKPPRTHGTMVADLSLRDNEELDYNGVGLYGKLERADPLTWD